MRKITISLALLIFVLTTWTTYAQNSIFFAGHVYIEDDNTGKQTMIPFATVRFYDVNNPSKTLATRISALDGSFDLKGFSTDNTYIVKVKAPGIEEQSFITRPNNGRVKSGNLSTHTRLQVDKNYNNPVKKQSFSPESISGEKNMTIERMIQKLPNLEIVDNDIMTKNGGSVRLMINGMNIDGSAFAKLKGYPVAGVVRSIDYYDLSCFDDSAYDGVVNIRLLKGKEAIAPDYKLISLKPYKK
ncbi:hypothetical protein [Seramator thermalis]|uniref:hypothetical protein n=1 Tax=Seramator thermalis TaxID=2496270 RepID=UPI00101B734A|nr:hypothetical protein [Seramator thermalis]